MSQHEKTEETNNQSPDTILPNQTDEEQIHLILVRLFRFSFKQKKTFLGYNS